MQKTAQTLMAPALARCRRGHHGCRFTPVAAGNGFWKYFWLTLPQFWFWRSRTETEREELVRNSGSGCFVCDLQGALEKDVLFGGVLPRLP